MCCCDKCELVFRLDEEPLPMSISLDRCSTYSGNTNLAIISIASAIASLMSTDSVICRLTIMNGAFAPDHESRCGLVHAVVGGDGADARSINVWWWDPGWWDPVA